jgi:hypothetical protein
MPVPEEFAKNLVSRAAAGVARAKNLDKALARIAGALHSTFYVRRVSLSVLVGNDQVVIAGLWTSQPTRLNKGAIVSASATVLPEIVSRSGTVSSAECSPFLFSKALQGEGLPAWIAVPVPNPRRIEGFLSLSAGQNVFAGHREFFSMLGTTVGDHLIELSRRTGAYMYGRESVLRLERSNEPLPRHIAL